MQEYISMDMYSTLCDSQEYNIKEFLMMDHIDKSLEVERYHRVIDLDENLIMILLEHHIHEMG